MSGQKELIMEIVKGYKATDKNMCCRGFQFELGKWYKHDGEIALCESGFHFCEYPSGPWSFYTNEGTRMFSVEARGVLRGEGPGASLKHVAMEIRLVAEIEFTGDRNTGDKNTGDKNTGNWNTGHGNTGNWNTGRGNTGGRNTGDRNTGDRNTGDKNTGNWNTGRGNTGDVNTGDRNTGHRNTGNWNTGHRNTGHENTGNWNTGHRNTGHGNTGDVNTGNWNATDGCAGNFCIKPQPFILFDEEADESMFDQSLAYELGELLSKDDSFDVTPFLLIQNATEEKIKALHQAHIRRRANRLNQ